MCPKFQSPSLVAYKYITGTSQNIRQRPRLAQNNDFFHRNNPLSPIL